MISGKGYGDGLRHLIFAENLTGETRNLHIVSGVLEMKVGVAIIAVLLLTALAALFYTDTKLLYSQSINTAEVEACNQATDSDADCQGIKKWRCRYINFTNPFAIRVEEEELLGELEGVLLEGVNQAKQGAFNYAALLAAKLPTKDTDTRFLVGQIVLEKRFPQSDFDTCPRLL